MYVQPGKTGWDHNYVHPCQNWMGPSVHPGKTEWDLMSTPVNNAWELISIGPSGSNIYLAKY